MNYLNCFRIKFPFLIFSLNCFFRHSGQRLINSVICGILFFIISSVISVAKYRLQELHLLRGNFVCHVFISRLSFISSNFIALVGHTKAQAPQPIQSEECSKNGVSTCRLLPLLTNEMADFPITSAQTRTHIPHKMQFSGDGFSAKNRVSEILYFCANCCINSASGQRESKSSIINFQIGRAHV